MAELATLVALRGRLKGTLTRTLTYVMDPPEGVPRDHIIFRIRSLEETWSQFVQATNDSYAFCDEAGYTDPAADYDQYETKYFNAMERFTRLLSELHAHEQVDANESMVRIADQQTQLLQQLAANTAKPGSDRLPRLEIPPFTGAYKDWPSFQDLFNSSVKGRDVTATHKFQLLKSLLKGEAAKVIAHIPVTEAAFSTAWTRLVDRYDRPRHIVNGFIEGFMALPSVTQENVHTLRTIADGANEVVHGLHAIDRSDRDCWLIHILLLKIDPDSRRKWIEESKDSTRPTIEEFLHYLDGRCEQLELARRKVGGSPRNPATRSSHALLSLEQQACPSCSETGHDLFRCAKFKAASVQVRRDLVKSQGLCFNCLKAGHRSVKCSSKSTCRECQQRHHTLLHMSGHAHSRDESAAGGGATAESTAFSPESTTSASNRVGAHSGTPWSTVSHVARDMQRCEGSAIQQTPERTALIRPVLPTAVVSVLSAAGHPVLVRALIDCASELFYISESCAQTLGLQRTKSRILVSGISASHAETTKGCVDIHVQSRLEEFSMPARVHILQKITSVLPTSAIVMDHPHPLAGLPLADPQYHSPAPIDVLLGAEYVWHIFTGHKVYSTNGNPIAVSSKFGWIVISSEASPVTPGSSSFVTVADVDRSLQRFWEIEESLPAPPPKPEDIIVEDHFCSTHFRGEDGRYVVSLPFKHNHIQFDDTLKGVLSRFEAVERRLERNQVLQAQYIEFMREYIRLGHMKELKDEGCTSPNNIYYLPHHSVVGPKLRVVFDGSFTDTKGVSLNSQLYVGPSIQRNLFSVCFRFRLHRYVFSADIIKMFRQIWVADEQRDYQRIVWRENRSEPLRHFQLCTVTYGTSCAPFLAVRVLEQLAKDHHQEYPNAARILLNDFYVDDVLTGAASVEELAATRHELVRLLACAGLELSKWVSNCELMTPHPNPEVEQELTPGSSSEVKKVLGLYWQPHADIIRYHLTLEPSPVASKRQVLSDVSRLFDPLGLLAPVVVQFKILFQDLWLRNLAWDDPLPPEVAEKWTELRQDLLHIENYMLPRFVLNDIQRIELHGFSDASTKAYGAAVYCRSKSSNGRTTVTLVAAKTRVAPLKQVSLPRLELCGALLLTRLISTIKQEALPTRTIDVTAWCDSTVVLAWLSQHPITLKTFVGNRTSEILALLPRRSWHHVPSKENPADCASRGMKAAVLQEHELWWKGPRWLLDDQQLLERRITNPHPLSLADPVAAAEVKPKCSHLLGTTAQHDIASPFGVLVQRVSTWNRLIRVTAYVLRFCNRIRPRLRDPGGNNLNVEELRRARVVCLRLAQDCFEIERSALRANAELNRKSSLLKLAPFLDADGLLPVGGRIRRSALNDNTCHPIILPKGHRVTYLIAQHEHRQHLHPGVTALFVILRQSYWIIGARNLIRALTHQCVTCFRHRRHNTHQMMSDLPAVRVRQALPFENTGCDYAGPLTLKLYRGRNAKTSKGYICLFVCLTTSAMHLELATDLTTDGFLAALRRFMARRGKCARIFSDNGRNFLGAARVLDDLQKQLNSETHNEVVSAALAQDGIRWSFIPPHAPHWGGIWESAVRSVKLHLRRVVGPAVLTFEQMRTLLAQIEAVVNSRPLGNCSDQDVDYLTPAHFLIGRATTALPEPDITEVNPNLLDYWRQIQAMYQGFWKRWSAEYLTSLQQRPKWCTKQRNVSTGELVLLKDNQCPPATWRRGRVMEVYHGRDGLIRSVKLSTAAGSVIRPISKIAVLPSF